MFNWLKAFITADEPINYGRCEYCRIRFTAKDRWLEETTGRMWHESCLRHYIWVEGLKKYGREKYGQEEGEV